MSKMKGDDLAFPALVDDFSKYQSIEAGLTKREYFALHILSGMYAAGDFFVDYSENSVKAADRLIAALNERGEK